MVALSAATVTMALSAVQDSFIDSVLQQERMRSQAGHNGRRPMDCLHQQQSGTLQPELWWRPYNFVGNWHDFEKKRRTPM